MPNLDKKAATELIKKRHPEWSEHQRRWRWLADSLEGGNRYRHADYTVDPTAVVGNGSSYAPWYNYGVDPTTSQPYPVAYRQIVDRNLIPHQRETAGDGRDVYVMRLARTPVPRLVERAVETHLAKVYGKEVRREGPDALTTWWADCDGRGTEIDRWVREAFAPLFLVLGQLDVCFDHPPAPEGAKVVSKADQRKYGLDTAVATVILPENMVWWRLDKRGASYEECLVFERHDDGRACYRHWTADESNAYDPEGNWLKEYSAPHPYKAVPVVRVFDRRLARQRNTGKSRYESVAEYQRAVYNAESERILSDVQQSHAQLMGPEEFCQSDSEIPIGPDRILPKKRNQNGSSVSYEPFEYLDPPKGAQEALREHVNDFKDEADRDSALLKPAGQNSRESTSQSGVSKVADQQDGNAVLGSIAESLEAAEQRLAAFALRVLTDGNATDADLAEIEVVYPRQFDLFTSADLAAGLDDIQRAAQMGGALPQTEAEYLTRKVTLDLPGLPDDRLAVLRGEIEGYLARAASAEQPTDPEDDIPPSPFGPAQGLPGTGVVASPSAVLISPTPS